MSYRNAAKLEEAARRTQQAGVAVDFSKGWTTRGHGEVAPRWLLWHHTASSGNALRIVRDGRAGLPGPLSQFHLSRTGLVTVVAAGNAYHAGRGRYPDGTSGNSRSLGIEADNRGTGEGWPQVQLDAYVALSRSVCDVYGWPASRVIGHKEYTSRKIDPYGIDMDQARAWVADTQDWFDMATEHDLRRIVREEVPYLIRRELGLVEDPDSPEGGQAGRKFHGQSLAQRIRKIQAQGLQILDRLTSSDG